ncbi:alpha-glucosidase [Enterococcus sp. ALS3]|uniref:Alpha-glucosidase n=1 Tax=Enterococcus alishanensis TaxID=1303817 RepID=A0ABS6TFG1_9ENTE|nr:alpha-glucosidase [Enterococcus alishanensis]MBV7391645.1 alpha-glucosidase [Enterococcus alishanensis]
MNSEWWKQSVVYQVYPKSFYDSNQDGSGDIRGIIEKLDYLKKLGIDVIWLNPLYQSPYVDNGYDISDYYQINPDFGTMADFDALLQEAHQRDIKIIMDLVVNHTSDQHEWFKKSQQVPKNKYRDYYIWKDPVEGHEPTNWGSSFGGSTWEFNEEIGQYYLHLFAKEQPDLNWENPEVRQEIYKMMRFWLDKGIDGFRMDVISLLSKKPDYPDGRVIQNRKLGTYYDGASNGPRVHEFLHEMYQEVLSHYDVLTVGETPNTNADQGVLYSDPTREELNMVFHFEHMHVDYGKYGKYSNASFKLTDLKKVLTEWQEKLYQKGWNSLYWNNHDQARVISRFGDDQEYRVTSGKMLATLLHFMQGTPYIYQGEEIGMTNVKFPELTDYQDLDVFNTYKELTEMHQLSHEFAMEAIHAKSRDNARTPMQWSEEKFAGFSKVNPWLAVNSNYPAINVEKALEDPNSLFYYYQKLIQLRKEYEIITTGRYQLLAADSEKIYYYTRETDDQILVVVCSFSNETEEFVLENYSDLATHSEAKLLSGNYLEASQVASEMILKPYEAVAYLFDKKGK